MDAVVGITSDQAPVTASAVPGPGTGSNRKLISRPILAPWLRAQSVNVTRHAAALRPFKRAEFGTRPRRPPRVTSRPSTP